jgi:SnoaL-like domain
MTSVDDRPNADGLTPPQRAFGPQVTNTGHFPHWKVWRTPVWRGLTEIAANVTFLATDKAPTRDTPATDRSIGGNTMHNDIPTLKPRAADAAIATHQHVIHTYEQAWNAHTFDFERDLGHFMAPDITIVSGGTLGGRTLLRETSDARADYVRGTRATVTITAEITHIADMNTTAVIVAEGDLSFTYPDHTTYSQRLLTSSTLRLLNGTWVFQHVHFGKSCF